jgi:hypothetical protein
VRRALVRSATALRPQLAVLCFRPAASRHTALHLTAAAASCSSRRAARSDHGRHATEEVHQHRLIEGGRYNVNLRWNGICRRWSCNGQTIDTWVVLAGGATVNTGYDVKDGERVPITGVSVVTKPGDVFFHPSAFYHGFSQVSRRHLLAEHPLGTTTTRRTNGGQSMNRSRGGVSASLLLASRS